MSHKHSPHPPSVPHSKRQESHERILFKKFAVLNIVTELNSTHFDSYIHLHRKKLRLIGNDEQKFFPKFSQYLLLLSDRRS